MKFTGRIRIPEIDHPGVPVTLDLGESHLEVTLQDGEPIGRWSLYDVRVRRLIASAFQIMLDGEEVTFLADDPIDFAYRGVEEMAATWARVDGMTMVRRAVVVRRSRRGTLPSRIAEMKAAMTDTLREFGGVKPAQSPASLPGAGVVEESAPEPTRAPPPEAVTPPLEEERRRLEEERRRLEEERRRLEEERHKALEVLEQLREKVEPVVEEPRPAPEPVVEEPRPEPKPVPEPAKATGQIPPLGTTAADGSQEVVVDLKDLEARPREPEPATGEVRPEPEPEPAMAGVTPAKSGLMGAVRAAFTRNGRSHDHAYADAPGGIGIVRKICVECGYVSITTED